jgi:hypothetical protein
MDICAEEEPPAFTTPSGTIVRCHLHQHGPVLAGQSVRLAHRWRADLVPGGPTA